MDEAKRQPTVVVFDVNETLTDMSPLRGRLVEVGASGALFDAWFAATLRDGFAVTAAGGYAEFADIARHTLTGLLASWPDAPTDPAQAADHVLAGLTTLEGLRRLREAGLRLVTLTNGATAMSEGALSRAGVLGLFEARLSVADAGRWKPAPESYAFAAATVAEPPGRLALVAVHPWDVDGAARAGLVGAWLNRSGAAYPPYLTGPAVTASSLPAVADLLLGR
jgi:2-haloacid dehalogenase